MEYRQLTTIELLWIFVDHMNPRNAREDAAIELAKRIDEGRHEHRYISPPRYG